MKKIFGRFKSSSNKDQQPKGLSQFPETLEYEVREKDLPKLHKAVWNGDLAKVKQLTKKDHNALDKENRTALHLAVVKGHVSIVQELLEWSAKTNLGDNQAKTPLMKAVECNKEDCVRLLLEYEASVDALDKEGSSSLHYAVRKGYTRIVAELIKHRADINRKNKQGHTPLHVSVIEKRDEVTRLLLENKADPNITDNNIRPPISYACNDGSITQVKLLLQANADPTIKDASGWLPEDLAEAHGHHACSQLIRDHNSKLMRSSSRQPDSASTTPRTPGSSATTPRTISSSTMTPHAEGGDSGLFGLPSINKEDSEEESTDVMSAQKTDENSWADDTDISQAIDEMKKPDNSSDLNDDFDEERKVKTPQPKLNLAAKVKLSDSESDKENQDDTKPGPPRYRKAKVMINAEQIRVVNKRIPGTGRSPGASPNPHSVTPSPVFSATPSPKPGTPSKSPNPFQVSRLSIEEDNSDDDHGLRRTQTGRVSFREDISEHSITDEDSGEEFVKPKRPRMQEIEDERPETTGYSPSAMSNNNSSNNMSSERIKDLMENLGLGSGDEAPDVDSDASFSDDDSEEKFEIPVGSKSDRNHYPVVPDDVTVRSDITTPRQGILKNKDDRKPQTFQHRPQDSDEDSKITVEAEINLTALKSSSPVSPRKDEPSEWDSEAPDSSRQTESKREESEWDSDVEDAVNPDKSADRDTEENLGSYDPHSENATPLTIAEIMDEETDGAEMVGTADESEVEELDTSASKSVQIMFSSTSAERSEIKGSFEEIKVRSSFQESYTLIEDDKKKEGGEEEEEMVQEENEEATIKRRNVNGGDEREFLNKEDNKTPESTPVDEVDLNGVEECIQQASDLNEVEEFIRQETEGDTTMKFEVFEPHLAPRVILDYEPSTEDTSDVETLPSDRTPLQEEVVNEEVQGGQSVIWRRSNNQGSKTGSTENLARVLVVEEPSSDRIQYQSAGSGNYQVERDSPGPSQDAIGQYAALMDETSDIDSINEAATPRTPRNKGAYDLSEDEEVQELEYEDTEEVAEGPEETIHEDVTFFNIPSPYDVNSPFDQIQSGSVETPTPNPQQTVMETDWKKEEVDKNEEDGEGEVDENEEEEEEEDSDASAWTSDAEELGESLAKRPGYTEVENEGFSPDIVSPNHPAVSSDEEESVSEWEIERKQRQKEAEQRQRLLRDEALRKQKEAQENQEAERQRQQQEEVERKRELERQELERQREERQRQREWEEEQRIEAERQQEWEEEERKKQEQHMHEAEEELLQERSIRSDEPDDEDEPPSRSFHGTSNRSLLFPKVSMQQEFSSHLSQPELKKPNLLVVKDFVKIPTKTAPNSLTIKQSGEIENESPVPVGEDQIDASHVRYVGSMPPVIHQTGAHDRISVQNEKQTQVVVEKVVSTVHTQNAKGQEVKVQSGVSDVAGAAQENGNVAVNSQQKKSRQLPKPREELNRIEAETKRGPHHDSLLPNGSHRMTLTGAGIMSHRSDGHSEGCSMDDEDSLDDLDSPRNSRPENSLSHLNGLYFNSVNYNSLEPGFDDDGLSVTSTENGDNSLAYRPENLPYGKDMLVTMNLSDPGAVLKLQEHLREHRRQLEHERNQKMLIESKYKSLGKEKNELQKRIDNLGQQKSKLEQEKLDLEAKIRNLEYSLSEEEEKRKNAEVLLAKTKEHLKKKEEAFTSEIESKQRAELTLRNIQIELRTANNQIKELEEEKEVLQRQLSNEKNAVQLQKKINGEQQRLHEQLQQENLRTSSQKDDVENKLEMADDDNKQFQDNVEKLKSENTAFKAEIQRQRARWTDENALLSADNEKLRLKVEDLKAEVKLIEEAMNKASVQHSLQLNSTRSEAAILNDTLQKERASNDKLEAELESIKSRLQSTTLQLEKAQQARGDLERKLHESREEWARQVEKKDVEVNTLKETSQNLLSRLNATETKLNAVENELHNSNTTLLERNNQLQQSVRDVQYYKSAQENFEQNYRHEKEQTEKLQKKLDSLQEKLSTHQHENLSLKQQLETAQVLADRSGFDLQEKISTIMVSIKASNEKAMDEKTYSLNDTISRLREELRISENRRNTLEQDLWKLNQESNDMIRKLSLAEASLEMASKAKESLEQERQHLKMDMEKLQQRYQSAQDRALECQSQVAGLVERLEKAEQNNILSSQQLANTSATMHAYSSTKGELEEAYQKLQVESVKMEAELKHEKQTSEMLQRDLQDSQKVRSSLEALCSNLKSTNAHLEEKLGSKHAEGFTVTDEKLTRSTVQHQAAESKELWEREVISRSKLGLRMAQLEKQKQETLNQAEEEKRKTRKALEQKRIAEAKFEAEQEKTSQLQKEVANLKNYLKVAKKKLKDDDDDAHGTRDARVNTINTAFDHERNAMEEMMVAVKAQMEALKQQLESEVDEKERLQDKNQKLQGELKLLKKLEHELKKISQSKIRLEDEFQSYKNQMESTYTEKGTMEIARKELEAQYRLELNRKLDEVNNYLEEQARARQRLDAAREEQYSKLSHEKKRLQEEVTDVRVKYEKAKAEKDTKEMEAKRYRDLYENEMQWRMRLSEQLFKFTDKAFNYKTKFVSERQKNRLYGSMGNLAYTSPVNGHSIDVSRINGSLMEDPLSNKLRAELDRSIAKHLEAAPHELPVVHPDDSVYSPSSFAKSNSEYMEILKRKFCV